MNAKKIATGIVCVAAVWFLSDKASEYLRERKRREALRDPNSSESQERYRLAYWGGPSE